MEWTLEYSLLIFIDDLYYKWRFHSGIEPNILYLGEDTYYEFTVELNKTLLNTNVVYGNTNAVIFYKGMLVRVVKDKSYVSFGWEFDDFIRQYKWDK